jgi:hypothetical protein
MTLETEKLEPDNFTYSISNMMNKQLKAPKPKEPELPPVLPQKFNASFVGHVGGFGRNREAIHDRLKQFNLHGCTQEMSYKQMK